MESLVATVAVLVALAAGASVQAQTPETDRLAPGPRDMDRVQSVQHGVVSAVQIEQEMCGAI